MNEATIARTALTIELPGGVRMSFQRIEPGEFFMGQRGGHGYEEPVHRVRISCPFFLGTFPVTQAQFAVCPARRHRNGFEGRPNHPAENLEWFEAIWFCLWLTRSGTLPKGLIACLPTEAEWEYACRAGSETEYYTGDGEAALGKAGWHNANSEGMTHPVGQKAPNDWGLFDMHGNIYECCHDLWDEWAYRSRVDGVCDPGKVIRESYYRLRLRIKGSKEMARVVRGGSWNRYAWFCRSACRGGSSADDRSRLRGFRVALVQQS